MTFVRFVRDALIAISVAGSAAAGAQTLAGDTIDAGMYFTVDTGYGVGRILGYGLDGPFVVENGFGDAKTYSGTFELNVEALYFEVDFLTSGGWQDGVVLRLTDFDFLEIPYPVELQGLGYIESNLVGPWSVSHTSDSIEVAWGGASFNENTYLKVFFPPSPVIAPPIPEPETWALMAVGLAGMGAAAKRRARR